MKLKSRLVVQGFAQIKGLDYFETYSAVLMKKSMRTLMAIATELNWETRHVDVTAAFLNSPIKEDVYMEQSAGFSKQGKKYVCKLYKSVYGLHQSGKDWSECITQYLLELELIQTVCEPCILFGGDLIIGVYVDDILVVGKKEQICWFTKMLSKKIMGKDLGETDDGICLNQSQYALKILEEFGMLNV